MVASVGSPTAPAGGPDPDPQLLKAGRNEAKAGTSMTTSNTSAAMSRATTTTVFQWLLAFRALNAFCLSTFFQPDEYFQSLEPAWRMAFGDGAGAWVTWVSLLPYVCSRNQGSHCYRNGHISSAPRCTPPSSPPLTRLLTSSQDCFQAP